MKARLFIFWLIAMLSIGIAQPQQLCGTPENPCKDGWKNFDYSNPNEDITKIPPDKIDIQKVINNNRGNELTVAQIKTNFDKIDDLTKVNSGNERRAILEKYGVTIKEFGQSAFLKGGILKATFGENEHITIGNEIYKKGFLAINQKGQIIFTPNAKITQLSIPKGDTLTVKIFDSTEKEKYIDIQNYRLKGTFKVNDDGTIGFLKNERATINNIDVFSRLHNINLCSTKSLCSGDYLYLGNKELMAKGTDITLKFNEYNPYFRLNSANSEKNLYLPLNKRINEEKDYLITILGDGKNYGALSVQVEKNLLPTIQTYGFVKVENDENKIEIENSKVSKILLREKTIYEDVRGSIPSAIIASNDINKVYIFDEDLDIQAKNFKDFKLQNERRLEIANKYNIELSGYFSNFELDIFAKELERISNKFDIDFKKFTIGGNNLKILEVDKRLRGEASVAFAFPYIIQWKPKMDLGSLKEERYLGVFKYIPIEELKKREPYQNEVLSHEIGHVISLSHSYPPQEIINDPELKKPVSGIQAVQRKLEPVSEFQREYGKLMQEFGIKFVVEGSDSLVPLYSATPGYLFPNGYSQVNLFEHQGVLFEKMINDPGWFTDPKVPEEERKQRQAFRDLY